MLGISKDCVAFAGKSNVYIRSLTDFGSESEGKNGETGAIRLFIKDQVGQEEDENPKEATKKQGHIECIGISADGKLLAVADSLHGLKIFERSKGTPKEWAVIFTSDSEKRIVKLQFTEKDNNGQYLTFLDKKGDIFAVRISISANHQQISKVKKLMGHTSFISDYIPRVQNHQIISCDRDEKIRISNFPDAFTIQGFKLGHKESVISLALMEQHGYLLSVSTRDLILWDFKKEVSGTSTEYLRQWEVKNLLPDNANEEVVLMKACSNENVVLVSLTFGGSRIAVFKIELPSMKIKFLEYLTAGSDLIFMEWTLIDGQMSLVAFTPLSGSLYRWKFTDVGGMSLEDSLNNLSKEVIDDVKALEESHRPAVVPMKKRQTTFEDGVAVNTPPSQRIISS